MIKLTATPKTWTDYQVAGAGDMWYVTEFKEAKIEAGSFNVHSWEFVDGPHPSEQKARERVAEMLVEGYNMVMAGTGS